MLDAQRRIAELEAAPAVTHAHYIDGATARRARTRRVVGTVAPDPALRVVGDEPANARAAAASTTKPRKRTRRASTKTGAAPAKAGAAPTLRAAAPLRAVGSSAPTAVEHAGSGILAERGQ